MGLRMLQYGKGGMQETRDHHMPSYLRCAASWTTRASVARKMVGFGVSEGCGIPLNLSRICPPLEAAHSINWQMEASATITD